MPKPAFHSPKRRIKRAKEHINNMERRIKSFFDEKPYAHVIDLDSDRTKEIHKVRFTKRLPDRASELALEAAEALRSALDQACFATAVAAKSPRLKYTYFPVADGIADLENVIKGRCKDIPLDIVTFLRTLNPYSGGNDTIWALNKLANSSKHAIILDPVASGIGQINFRYGAFGGGTEFFSRWDAEKNEIAFAAIPLGSNPQYDAQISLSVAFSEVDAVRGQPPAPLLRQMTTEVERIVLAIEAEVLRLGLI